MDRHTEQAIVNIVSLKRFEKPDAALMAGVEREFHRRLQAEMLRRESSSLSARLSQISEAWSSFCWSFGKGLVPVAAAACIVVAFVVSGQMGSGISGVQVASGFKLDVGAGDSSVSASRTSDSLKEFMDFSRSLEMPSSQAAAAQTYEGYSAVPVVYDEANISF